MKTLNEYISESLLDDEEDLAMNDTILIKQFLKDNYNTKNCTYTIKNGVVDVKGLIEVKNSNITSLTNDLFQFGETGPFYCDGCEQLTSLKGAPRKVKGDFNCSGCNLTTLEGAPIYVETNFDCGYNPLQSLKGSPSKVGQWYICCYTDIKNLIGISKNVECINCSSCENLTSFEGAPNKVECFEFVDSCNVKNLKYLPHIIKLQLLYPYEFENIKEEIKKYNINVKTMISSWGD